MSSVPAREGAFELVSDFRPRGDQPAAIEALASGLAAGEKRLCLLGVTGSGKTFTIANAVARANRPTLVLAPNKTLAAQLYAEFRALFPKNAVEYFVSYYDYYQPEAYVPSTDTYIEKDASINERIERMRNSATRSLLDRNDCLIVASVSCIYGLGSPESYEGMSVSVKVGDRIDRDDLLRALARIQYSRNHLELVPGVFRVRGDVVEVFPAYEEERVVRIEMLGEEIEAIAEVDPKTGEVLATKRSVRIYPTTHYVTPTDRLERACVGIERELEEHLPRLRAAGKETEAERLETRTRDDLAMLRETGMCRGIENYSRHLDGRAPGQPPFTLLNYFPPGFLLVVDESHVTIPQLGGMFRGDRSRKETLVEYGFRLPSALDNRPLKFEEFERLIGPTVYVSATPGPYEKTQASGRIVEQVVRPTGLLDPRIEVRPAKTQVDDLLHEIRRRAKAGERVLVTTLTKRMAEELTEYYTDLGVKAKYLHADIETIERTALLRDLRLGAYDVLIGINLLREGLDLPEVSLVAILDADKEGFLRSTTSLIQTCGRAARNLNGLVLLYADSRTDSMRETIAETDRRRAKQEAFNREHGITPESVKTAIRSGIDEVEEGDWGEIPQVREEAPGYGGKRARLGPEELRRRIRALRRAMAKAAADLDFEKAARLRDEVFRLERREMEGAAS
ncbi:MAG: excinuclease ABC subunit UvrB [Planctomycetes bacterium]|nr:excinuclease ABC subunit UvrB [Planctomycetota bacterium]